MACVHVDGPARLASLGDTGAGTAPVRHLERPPRDTRRALRKDRPQREAIHVTCGEGPGGSSGWRAVSGSGPESGSSMIPDRSGPGSAGQRARVQVKGSANHEGSRPSDLAMVRRRLAPRWASIGTPVGAVAVSCPATVPPTPPDATPSVLGEHLQRPVPTPCSLTGRPALRTMRMVEDRCRENDSLGSTPRPVGRRETARSSCTSPSHPQGSLTFSATPLRPLAAAMWARPRPPGSRRGIPDPRALWRAYNRSCGVFGRADLL